MGRRRIELIAFVIAVGLAVAFALLWLRAPSGVAANDILVVDLTAAKDADANMPYPVKILDRTGKEVAGFDHHGIPQALPIAPGRYPVVVVAGFSECRSGRIKETAEAVVEIGIKRRGCVAWQIA